MPETTSPTDSKTSATTKTVAEYSPPPQPGKLRRGLISLRRWARETFSREQMLSGVKQLAWVAPLTILIWVYAEREQQDDADVRFAVEVRTSNPKSHVRLREPSDGYVSATLRGPRARLEQLSNELGPRASAVRFEVDPDLREGERQLPLAGIVKSDSRFDGVTIKSSQPPLLTVVVDTVEEVSVPVQIREEDRSRFDQVVFTPANVKIRMPKQALDRVRAASKDGQIEAHADLALIANQAPGQKTNIPGVRVAVANAGPEDVAIDPPTVSVSAIVREADKPYPINTLPIDGSGATRVLNSVNVLMEKYSLFNVEVVGPSEAIEEIDNLRAENVKAYVTIGSDDVGKGPLQKEIWFVLPPGVKVKSIDGVPVVPGQPPTVEVTVESKIAG